MKLLMKIINYLITLQIIIKIYFKEQYYFPDRKNFTADFLK